MDFFQAQDNARKSTARLIIYFMLAVLFLILLTNLLIMVVFGLLDDPENLSLNNLFDNIDWPTFFLVGLGVVALIGAGSLYKTSRLSGGGKIVAESLGGQPISQSTTDLNERKILNVVEEMAIASGTPVPPVYLLPEENGINAFAAGFKPGDAVIGITRGSIERLSRDELQGVIAHEFSHILNGDMRMNIRLIGILHGILLIGIIGYYLLRSAAYGRRRSSKDNSAAVFLALGLGLLIIGYAGTFFGNLIKASVSRQREYLADSSAVQFTRNPGTIAGALKKIGGLSLGSRLESPNAPSMSHAYFSQGIKSSFSSMFATHPPLKDRIKRIEPNWNGEFVSSEIITPEKTTNHKETAAERKDKFVTAVVTASVAAQNMLDSIGHASEVHLQHAAEIIHAIPIPILNAAHEPYGARAVIYSLLLNDEKEIRVKQLKQLDDFGDTGIFQLTQSLSEHLSELTTECRLPLIDICIPSLRELSKEQYDLFKNNLSVLIKMDNKIDLFEWSLQKILFKHLEPEFYKVKQKSPRYTDLSSVQQQCETLISYLLFSCVKDKTELKKAVASTCKALGFKHLNLLAKNQLDLDTLSSAVDELALLKPLAKPKLLKACLTAVTQDNEYSPHEIELLRAIADTLDCPIPLYLG